MPLANTVQTYGRKLKDQRWTLARWRLRTERAVLSVTGRQRPRATGRVLSYHSTGTPEWGVNDVAPRALLAQLNEAQRLGYSFVPASRVADGLSGPRELAVTFDDGLRSIMAVTPALGALEIPFTVFVVTDWALDPGQRFLSWGDLERLVSAGAEIGSHSRSHQNFRDLPESLRIAELVESRQEIERHLGRAPDLFGIPYGSSRDWDAECGRLALSAGYSAVFAQSENKRPAGTIGRSFVTKYDRLHHFRALLQGRFDAWEEWV